MAHQSQIVPAAFISNERTFLEEAVGASKESLHEGQIALWFFWQRPETKEQFREANSDPEKIAALREQARQYVTKKVKSYWWSLKFGREIPFSSLVPEETEEKDNWRDFWGILASNPEPGDQGAEEKLRRYWELKKEIQTILAKHYLKTVFGENNGKVHPWERDDWRILEKFACGWTLKRLADDVGLSADAVSNRLKEVRELLWQELSDKWLPRGFNGEEKSSVKEFTAEDFEPPKISKEEELDRRRVALTPEELEMPVAELRLVLREKYGVELHRSSLWRAKKQGWFYKNYLRSFFVEELVDSYHASSEEREAAPDLPATVQQFRKDEQAQEKVRSLLDQRCATPEVAQRRFNLLFSLASGISLKEACEKIGIPRKTGWSHLKRLRQQLLGIIEVPSSKEIQDEYILESLKDGAVLIEVAENVFEGENFSGRNLKAFRYGRLRRIKRQRGL